MDNFEEVLNRVAGQMEEKVPIKPGQEVDVGITRAGAMKIWDAKDAIQLLKQQFNPQIELLRTLSQTIAVTNEETEKQAVEASADIKRFLKEFDERRKRIIDIPDSFVREINKFAKMVRDTVEPLGKTIERKRTDYAWQKELDRRKKEKEAQEAAARLQEKINAEAKKEGIEAPEIPVIPVEKPKTVVRTESGASSYIRTDWKVVDILDYSKVPAEYKTFDLNDEKEKAMFMAKVNRFVKAGIRNIDGLEIGEVPTNVTRT